jgi:hypothetical protein
MARSHIGRLLTDRAGKEIDRLANEALAIGMMDDLRRLQGRVEGIQWVLSTHPAPPPPV